MCMEGRKSRYILCRCGSVCVGCAEFAVVYVLNVLRLNGFVELVLQLQWRVCLSVCSGKRPNLCDCTENVSETEWQWSWEIVGE